jgi:hypothetical protein
LVEVHRGAGRGRCHGARDGQPAKSNRADYSPVWVTGRVVFPDAVPAVGQRRGAGKGGRRGGAGAVWDRWGGEVGSCAGRRSESDVPASPASQAMSPSRGQRREGRFSEPLPDRVSKAGLCPPGGRGGRRGGAGALVSPERVRRQAPPGVGACVGRPRGSALPSVVMTSESFPSLASAC